MKKKMTIILIDDNEIDLFINKQFITQMNITDKVLEFSFANEALTFLQENYTKYASFLILCDINMPVMDGFKFIQEYASLSESLRKNCNIIMISSSLDDNDRVRASEDARVMALLKKPINTSELKLLLENADLI